MGGPPGHRRGPRSPRGQMGGAAGIHLEPIFDLSFQRLFQVPAGKLLPRAGPESQEAAAARR